MVTRDTKPTWMLLTLALICVALTGCSEDSNTLADAGLADAGHADAGRADASEDDAGGDSEVEGPCRDNGPCVHGTCGFEGEDVFCDCPSGFDGDHCEQDIDECELDLCQNDATCFNEPGSYACLCHSGWTGADCADDVDECSQGSLCLNGGTCVNYPGSFDCDCPPPYSGVICQVNGS